MTRLNPFPAWIVTLLSPIVVILTTWALYLIQNFVAHHSGRGASGTDIGEIRPYGIGFVIPIALIAIMGGLRPGLLTLALSLISLDFILTPPYFHWIHQDARAVTELIFVFAVGLIVIFGIDAMRKNAQLLAAAQVQAAREALLRQIQEETLRSTDPNASQAVITRCLGEALHVDRCYFSRYDLKEETVTIEQDWRRTDLPSVVGQHPLPKSLLERRRDPNAPPTLTAEDITNGIFAQETVAFLEGLQIRAVISVPFLKRGELMATLSVAMSDGPRAWTPEEVSLIERVSALAQGVVEVSQMRHRERNIAAILQEALQPTQTPPVPGMEIAPFYQPALAEASVGGDFYDVFEVTEEVFALIVGDVSGKGLAAAAQVAIVRNMLRCLLYREPTVREAVTQLNQILAKHSLLSGFTTLFVGLWHATARRLTYVSCGHEPGLLRRDATGAIEELPPTGPILGAFAGMSFTECPIQMFPGDLLILYTDGVTDAGPRSDDYLGVSGLTSLIEHFPHRCSPAALVAHIIRGVTTHSGDPLRDDACILVART